MNRRLIIVSVLAVLLCMIITGAAVVVVLLTHSSEIAGLINGLVSPIPGTEIAAGTVTLPPTLGDETEGTAIPSSSSVPTETPEAKAPPPPPEIQEQMAAVQSQVSAMRQLAPTREVTKAFMTETELRQLVEEDWLEDYSPEEARDDARALSAFDFVPPDIDLYTLYLELYTEQVAGFYDSETKEFFLISSQGTLGGFERLTFAHEYTHALQDMHFDLEGYDMEGLFEENYDAGLGLLALIEGDAELITERYLVEHFTAKELQDLFGELGNYDTTVYDNAPLVIQRDLEFPYIEGVSFAQALYDTGGWERINSAYANPPVSTEQILHPERYLSGEQPQPVTLQPALDVLGPGWRLLDEATFGEFYLSLYLEQQLGTTWARAAADGWGGDRYTVFYNDGTGQLVMVLDVVWDNPVEADEFADAYRQYGAARTGVHPSLNLPDLTCWTSQDHLCFAQSDAQTWVVLGPDPFIVEDILAQYQIAARLQPI